MHRLTARVLLTLLLVGTFAPLALAISAPAPHACCMRKPMSGDAAPGSQFSATPDCCNHDCCRVVTTSQSAWIVSARNHRSAARAKLSPQLTTASGSCGATTLHSGRSPPQFSIA